MITDIRQLDLALKNHLSGITCQDANGQNILVPVLYINPEKEFKIETYPSIIFYRSGIYPDNTRWVTEKFYDNAEYEEDNEDMLHSIDEREAPMPYAVYYGVRLYYEYISDGTSLNNYLLNKMGRRAFVIANGSKYDIEFVSYKNPSATYREFGVIKSNTPREFIDQYLYMIPIELDSSTRNTVLVNKHGVNVTITDKEG